MIRHLSGLGEVVDDVAAAVAFYRDVLGLTVEYTEGEEYATIQIGGTLHYGIWGRAAAAGSVLGDAGQAQRVPLGFCAGFEVDDVDAAAEAMTARGLKLIQSPKTEPWGQKTARFILPGGSLGEITETPWARELPGS